MQSEAGWEPPSPVELQAMLPQYEISEIIGHGGMGAVYKGRQAKLNRTVAIKLLPETFLGGDDELNFAKRFEQEAQAMANLDHPAIISVHDFGETPGGQLYFVMEFIDGMDIHQYLQHHGGKLPQEHALSITAHVLDALDYAHSHGIVHRDIKPANILLNQEGRVKIADFGLAKKFGEHADDAMPALTVSNVAVGTPDFVAPEALDASQVPDHRADLYAVGVMLYQMLTGKLPRGNFQMPSELDPGVDSRLDDIVSTAMASDPDLRYASAHAVRSDLDLVLSQPLVKVEPGEESRFIESVVPVTTGLRGKKAAGASSSKRSLYVAFGVTAAVILGLIVFINIGAEKEGGDPASVQTVPVDSIDPQSASREAPFENTLGMKFVPLPDTEVLFCIHEVRYKDYSAFASETEGVDTRWKDQSTFNYLPKDDLMNHPVIKVNREYAQAFCRWLSRKEGRTYRLPTDQEWSLAVGLSEIEEQAEDSTPGSAFQSAAEFSWGTEFPPPEGIGNFSDASRKLKAPHTTAQYLEGYDDGFPTTAPVMSFPPNRLGIFDLEGNVKEWTYDLNESSWMTGVVRGGSFVDHERKKLQSSYRNRHKPSYSAYDFGIRLVLELPSDAP